jgi:Cu+-exporting ATPase
MKMTRRGSLLVLGLLLGSPARGRAGEPSAPRSAQEQATASFAVDRMHCDGCADRIRTTLGKAPGVLHVEVKLADRRVQVLYDAARITPEQIARIMTDLGYPARILS